MSVSRIPKNTVVKIDGEGTGVVKSSKFEIDETIYDVEIEGINNYVFAFFSISAWNCTGEKADNGKYIFTFPISWGFWYR